MSKVYTSYDEVNRAFNKVRNELFKIRVLWDGSRLDGVGCTYLTIAPIGSSEEGRRLSGGLRRKHFWSGCCPTKRS